MNQEISMNTATLAQNRGFVAPRAATFAERLLQIVEALEHRFERQRQRRALLTLDTRMLNDIGISRGEALAQGSKPFWVD
jgi:uncharacterized protein YjiS (DUF1127 family)